MIKSIYNEYLADKFLFEIDKEILRNGKIIPDILNIKGNQDKGIFLTLGRLFYYCNFYDNNSLNDKIKDLLGIIKNTFDLSINNDVDEIINKLKNLCRNFNNKSEEELKYIFNEIEYKIDCLKLNEI